MHSPKNAGRLVGLLYLLVSIPGFFWLIYVPHKLIVRGDASLTATNIAAHETLFHAGLACDVLGEILFLWVVLALYDLFKNVSHRQAAIMFGLFAISVPITLLNDLNAIAASSSSTAPTSSPY